MTPVSWLGLAYLQKKQYDKAIATIQESVTLSGGSAEEKAYLGYAFAVAGRRSDAMKILAELNSLAAREYISPYLSAVVAVGLGKHAEALDLLNKVYDARSVNLIYLTVEPIFDDLRSDPRFQDLLHRVGLPFKQS